MFEKTYGEQSVTIKGRWKAVLTDESGEFKDSVEGDNLVVTNGKEYLANFIQSATTSAALWTQYFVAVGSDNTAAALANTALGTELARHTGTASYTSGAIYEVVATFAAGVGTGYRRVRAIFSQYRRHYVEP